MSVNVESAVKDQIREYVKANMSVFSHVDLKDEDNIFQLGFVTSMFAMQLLTFIESTFDVEVPDDQILLRNFSTVQRMSEMVGKLSDD